MRASRDGAVLLFAYANVFVRLTVANTYLSGNGLTGLQQYNSAGGLERTQR